MVDPAIRGFRDQVGTLERYAELVIANDQARHEDRQHAEKVLRQARGLWRLLDHWHVRPGTRVPPI